MTVYFDTTALSPTQTSLVTVDYFRMYAARRGGYSYLTWAIDANGDYVAGAFGTTQVSASSRAAIHGGTDGVWYFKDFATWTAAPINDGANAKAAAENVLIQQALNRAASILSGLEAICGTPPTFRVRSYTGSVTADNLNSCFTAPAADNAFTWADYTQDGTLNFTGFSNDGNNGKFTVVDLDTSADPHVLTVINAPSVDEIASATLTLYYEPGLSFPREWSLYRGSTICEDRAATMPASSVTPKVFSDANALLAINFLRGDMFSEQEAQAAGKDLPVKKVDVFESVKVEFETSNSADLSRFSYIPDEVLHLLSPYLCAEVRGYGTSACAESSLIEAGDGGDDWW